MIYVEGGTFEMGYEEHYVEENNVVRSYNFADLSRKSRGIFV